MLERGDFEFLLVGGEVTPGLTGFTVNELLVPVFPESEVVVIVTEFAWLRVTWPVQIPAVNAPVLAGLIVPEDADKVFVPV